MDSEKANSDADRIINGLIEIVKDLTSDYDIGFSGTISGETRLMNDLAFESIDVVHLAVAIQERLGCRDIPFEKLFMVEGRYVTDLTISQIAGFLKDFA